MKFWSNINIANKKLTICFKKYTFNKFEKSYKNVFLNFLNVHLLNSSYGRTLCSIYFNILCIYEYKSKNIYVNHHGVGEGIDKMQTEKSLRDPTRSASCSAGGWICPVFRPFHWSVGAGKWPAS